MFYCMNACQLYMLMININVYLCCFMTCGGKEKEETGEATVVFCNITKLKMLGA